MSDANLLTLGAAVSFIALAGAYAYLRECFLEGQTDRRVQPVRVETDRSRPAAHRARDAA